ncbi:protein MIS12 homolog [Orussus abietinus]|uniref:protein MIS12 homolog n=1 Tax=Orussus abietinus TaxID=222816 RepID=UPI0006268BC9|nr:protein MIS12 homolog [Orussus abietinus]
MASVDLEKRKREEYEMQLFDIHSRSFYTTLKDLIYESIQSNCEKLCKSIETNYKLDLNDAALLKEEGKQLIALYHQNAQSHLEIIENTVNKFINIPRNVLLDEDKEQATQYTKEEFLNLQSRLKQLQQKVKHATMLNAALKQELQEMTEHKIDTNMLHNLCDIIEAGIDLPVVHNNMLKLTEKWQEVNNQLYQLDSTDTENIYRLNIDSSELKTFDEMLL